MRSRRGPIAAFALSVLLAAATWVVGFFTALELIPPPVPAPPGIDVPANFDVFAEAWRVVRREFYWTPPEPDDITYGAIQGILATLDDPYADFRAAAEVQESGSQLGPQVASGVGAWIEHVPGGALIVSSLPDSPARRAGLVPGDIIAAIDGEPIAGMDRSEIMAVLDGDPGTPVVVTMVRSGEAPFDVELVRDALAPPAVEVRVLDGPVAYLRIAIFDSHLVGQLDAALEDLSAAGVRGLVLDLRNNPGGDVKVLLSATSRLVSGPLWTETSRRGSTGIEAEAGAMVPLPLDSIVVIVNGGTASAAEMMAAALRDAGGATLVGQTTFGKATLQGILPLADGSVVRLTTARWSTPKGTNVAAGGLTPDLVVDEPDGQLATALEVARTKVAAGG